MEIKIRRLDSGLKTVELVTDNGTYQSDEWASPVAAMIDLKRKLFAVGFEHSSDEIACVESSIDEFSNGKNEY